MRRNLTISFDEDFIRAMDADRGETSRGKWLEGNGDMRIVEGPDGLSIAARLEPYDEDRAEALRKAIKR